MSKQREKKEQIVATIKEKLEKAKSLVFANYQGLTHKQLEELKKSLKAVDAELSVTKNTLLMRALQNGRWNMSSEAGSRSAGENSLDGPTATLFAYGDALAALKELAKTIKLLKLPTIKFGILDGKALTADDLLKLALLPSRDVLIAQVVGGMKTPLFGLHRALAWNLARFVLTLKAIESKKTS